MICVSVRPWHGLAWRGRREEADSWWDQSGSRLVRVEVILSRAVRNDDDRSCECSSWQRINRGGRRREGWSCDVGDPCDLRSFYTLVCCEAGNGGFVAGRAMGDLERLVVAMWFNAA
jgi:hypothetical protein